MRFAYRIVALCHDCVAVCTVLWRCGRRATRARAPALIFSLSWLVGLIRRVPYDGVNISFKILQAILSFRSIVEEDGLQSFANIRAVAAARCFRNPVTGLLVLETKSSIFPAGLPVS